MTTFTTLVHKHARVAILILLLFALLYLLPLAKVLRIILSGDLPFWYDPARDLLMGINLHSKFSLIGPESGIPMIFYGPYWWWLMGLGTLFTKDPRYIAIGVLTIPYFTLLPYLLWKFARVFGLSIVITLWGFYIFTFTHFAIQLWNPHLASIFMLLLIYLLAFVDITQPRLQTYVRLIAAGITYGVLGNFNPSLVFLISPGIVFIFVLWTIQLLTYKSLSVSHRVRHVITLAFLFALGTAVGFAPLILFEMRHGFMQLAAMKKIITESLLYKIPAVGQVGYTRMQILIIFSELGAKLLFVPAVVGYTIYFQALVLLVFGIVRRTVKFTSAELRVAGIPLILSASFLGVSATTANPVFNYHFTGMEIAFLLLFGFIMKKISPLSVCGAVWLAVIIGLNLWYYVYPKPYNPLTLESYRTKHHIVETIYQDVGTQGFAILAYSPAIHTYDYDYMIRWIVGPKYSRFPLPTPRDAAYTYLIIPNVSQAQKLDFIDYKTPHTIYYTVRQWELPDKTTIVKRVPKGQFLNL